MTQSTPPTMPALTPAQQRKLDTISEIVWEIRESIQERRDARAAQAAENKGVSAKADRPAE